MTGIAMRLLALVLLLSTCAIAQSDHHLSADPAGTVVRRSTWMHGYIHGYEVGFHYGNLDFHLGRAVRHDVEKVKPTHKSEEYRSEYGPKKDFKAGYKEGLRVGYWDAYRGRDLRVFSITRQLAPETVRITGSEVENRPDPAFDRDLTHGYFDGRKAGLAAGRARSSFDDKAPECSAGHSPDCSGYHMGYRLGYSDGFYNQYEPNVTRASVK